MSHTERVVNHIEQILAGSQYAKLISNHIMNDVPDDELDEVFNAIEDAGFIFIWQFQILTVYRAAHV